MTTKEQLIKAFLEQDFEKAVTALAAAGTGETMFDVAESYAQQAVTANPTGTFATLVSEMTAAVFLSFGYVPQ